MKTVKLGTYDLNVGAMAYGCSRFAESSISEASAKIHAALDAGMTLADVIPITVTQNIDRIKYSAKAAQIPLTGRDFYDIIEAYRGKVMP